MGTETKRTPTHSADCGSITGEGANRCNCSPRPWYVTTSGDIRNALGGSVSIENNQTEIVRAVNAYKPMLDALKFAADKSNDPALVAVIDEAIAKSTEGL